VIDIGTRMSSTVNLEQALDRFEARIRQEKMLRGVAKAAEVMAEEVRLNATKGGPEAPDRQSGDLEEAVYRAYIPERSTGAEKVYYVAVRNRGAFYWRFLEFGTSKMLAQPFIRPSLAKLDDALRQGVQAMKD
jgi:HK97 gp10 family phage protein